MKRIFYAAVHRPLPERRPEIDPSSIFEERGLVQLYIERQQFRSDVRYDLVRIAKIKIEEVTE